MNKVDQFVNFPMALAEIIELRRLELGFEHLSDYVASVIRYDLLLGWPS